MRILIVEDEKSLAEIIGELLGKQNYIVDIVHDGCEGYEYAMSNIYDLVLLDVMIPSLNGYELVKKLRCQKNSVPVIMLTAKSELEDKVKGLDFGADDYITKPFETKELLARIRSVTRRKEVYQGEFISYGNATLDKKNLNIFTKRMKVKLTLKEFNILEILMSNSNQIITREALAEKIWGYDYQGEYNTVEVYISFVRKKLKFIESNVNIKASRGLGYLLEVKDD